MALPSDVRLMLRGPSAAPDGKPIGALEAPIRWVKVLDLVNHCPGSLVRRSPPTPLAMGATVDHMESHTVSIHTHVWAFLNICVRMTRVRPSTARAKVRAVRPHMGCKRLIRLAL